MPRKLASIRMSVLEALLSAAWLGTWPGSTRGEIFTFASYFDATWFACRLNDDTARPSWYNWSIAGTQVSCYCWCTNASPPLPGPADVASLGGPLVIMGSPGASILSLILSPGTTLDLRGSTAGDGDLTVANGFDVPDVSTIILSTTGGYRAQLTVNGDGLNNYGTVLAKSYSAWEPRMQGTTTNHGLVDVENSRLTYLGPVFTNAATLRIRGVGSRFTVTSGTPNSFVQTTDGHLYIELGGAVQETGYGQLLSNTWPVMLDGALHVSLIQNFTPTLGNAFRVVSGTHVTGTFSEVDFPPLVQGIGWRTQYDGLGVLLSVEPDPDEDGIVDALDNCPTIYNPMQADHDAAGGGDVCDVCPADPNDACNSAGSAGAEVSAGSGGTVVTPNAAVTIDVGPGDLTQDTTIAVTEQAVSDPSVLIRTPNAVGAGTAVATYELTPSGIAFASPVFATFVFDVSALSAQERLTLGVYTFLPDVQRYDLVPSSCMVTEGPTSTFTATCSADLSHFSLYALVSAGPLTTIPAVSTWGLVALLFMLLIAGTLVLHRSRYVSGTA